MKIYELIAYLQQFPAGAEVVGFDELNTKYQEITKIARAKPGKDRIEIILGSEIN